MDDSKIYAVANITGDISAPDLKAVAYFKPFKEGTMVEIEASGLPGNKTYLLYPIHIHDGLNCNISKSGSFDNVGTHYNPTFQNHPYHAGDMPVLFSNNGYAYMKFYTSRFKVFDIKDKLVIIHEQIENENSTSFGRKIGCGKIVEYNY